MKNITEQMEKHQNNINDLQQQLKNIKKTQKKLGIIIPTVTLVTLALLISPYIKMANAISSFEQLQLYLLYNYLLLVYLTLLFFVRCIRL